MPFAWTINRSVSKCDILTTLPTVQASYKGKTVTWVGSQPNVTRFEENQTMTSLLGLNIFCFISYEKGLGRVECLDVTGGK